MVVNKKIEADTLTAEVSGRLDTTTAPELDEALGTSLDGINSLVLDFAELDYISSAGLRVLLTFHKKMMKTSGGMVVKNVGEMIMEIFEVTGFSSILNIEE